MRITGAAAAACLAIGICVAHDADAAIKRTTAIPPQPLAPALQTLVKERDIQIVYRAELIGDRRTNGATGELTAVEVLTQLLNGTGLTYTYLDGKTITILPLPSGDSKAPDAPWPVVKQAAPVTVAKEVQKPSFWDRFRLAQVDQGAAVAGGLDSGSGEKAASRVEEVVVTAQKREERLQNVPISISVLTGEQLDRSTDQGVNQALTQVPGVAAFSHTQAGGTVVTVRGVTASGPVFAGSSPVSYYLDSVPFGLVQTAISPDANAYDLQRVEVLRGPQGTLYGASAQAGVVRVITNDADLDDFSAKLRASDSSTTDGGNNYRGDAAVNVPIVEGKLAARATVGYENLSGWIDQPIRKDANDAELRNARLKINAQPTDRLSIGASMWFTRNDYGGLSAGDDKEQRNAQVDESYSIDYDVFGVKVAYELPTVSISSSTSYIDYSSGGGVDVAIFYGFPVPLFTNFDANVFSQEFNLASIGEGPWKWTAGAIYRDGKDRTVQAVPNGILNLDWTNTSKSYALFGELSRRFLNDALEWTLGARYFKDDVVSREDQDVPPANPPSYYRAADSFDSTTPRAVLTWHPHPDLSVYASYSEGFRSGTPQPYYVTGGVPGFPSVKPDKLHNFEIGAKSGAYALSFDAAIYYIDWKDVQQQLSVPFGITPVTAIVNGESASGLGVDLGVTLRPIDGLEFGVNGSWNDLTMDADILSGGVVLFAKGDRPNFSPKYTLGTFAEYAFPMGGSGYRGRLSASANYTAEQGFRSIVGPAQVLAYGGDMTMVRASFAIQAPQRWSLTLFADNLTNESDSVVGNPFFGADAAVRIRPRTVGLQLEYRF